MTNDDSDSTDSTDMMTTPTRRRVLAGATSTLALAAVAGCLSGDSSSDGSDTANDSPGYSGSTENTPSDVFNSVSVGRHYLTVALKDPDSLRSVALKRPTDGVIEEKQAQKEVEILLMRELGYSPGEFVLEARTENEAVAEHTLELQPEPRVTKVELLKNQERENLTWGNGYLCAASPHAHIYSIKNVGTAPAVLSEMKFEMPDEIDWDSGNGIRCHSPGDDVEWDGAPVLGPDEEMDFSPTARQHDGYRSQEPGNAYEVTMGVVEDMTGDWFEQTATMEFIDIGEGNRYPIFEIPPVSED
jgi:hypothetical protein